METIEMNELWNRAIDCAVEKVDDQLCFVPEPDSEYRTELSREYAKGQRDAYRMAKKEIYSLVINQ